MAKRVSPFAEDFQAIKKSADDKVLAFLQQGKSEQDAEEKKAPKEKTAFVEKPNVDEAESGQRKTVRKNEAVAKKTTERKPKQERRAEAEWGRPTALFNTRIPERMSELLDDLVYQRKKQGRPCTKQAIAIEALEMLLGKEGFLTSHNTSKESISVTESH